MLGQWKGICYQWESNYPHVGKNKFMHHKRAIRNAVRSLNYKQTNNSLAQWGQFLKFIKPRITVVCLIKSSLRAVLQGMIKMGKLFCMRQA